MGLFDTITTVLFCPYCGSEQKPHSFQTKEFDFSYDSYDLEGFKAKLLSIPHGLVTYVSGEMHHICDDCGAWISVIVEAKDEKNQELLKEQFERMEEARKEAQ